MEWLFFSCFMKWNWRPLSLKSCHFEASKDIMTKFKSQALHIIKINYWNADGSGNPPFFILALLNIVTLFHKQATLGKHFKPKCTYFKNPPHCVRCWLFAWLDLIFCSGITRLCYTSEWFWRHTGELCNYEVWNSQLCHRLCLSN